MAVEDVEDLVLEETVEAAPAAVWSAIAEKNRLAEWWSYIEIEARVGGRLIEVWRDSDGREEVTRGEVLEVEPGRRLLTTWQTEGWPAATEVEITLRPEGDSTLITLRQAGWEALGQAAAEIRTSHEVGWRMHLRDLKQYVESAAPG